MHEVTHMSPAFLVTSLRSFCDFALDEWMKAPAFPSKRKIEKIIHLFECYESFIPCSKLKKVNPHSLDFILIEVVVYALHVNRRIKFALKVHVMCAYEPTSALGGISIKLVLHWDFTALHDEEMAWLTSLNHMLLLSRLSCFRPKKECRCNVNMHAFLLNCWPFRSIN